MGVYVITASSDTTTVDLTDPAVNPQAAPTSTPRQGGFTLRNRWDCSQLATAATFAASDIAAVKNTNAVPMTATPFFVLQVPARTLVEDISVFAIPGETQPDHGLTASGSATTSTISSSDLKTGTLKFYAVPWKKSDGTSAATAVDAFGEFDLTATSSADGKGSIAGSFLAPSYSASSLSSASTPTNAGLMMGNAMTSGAWGAGTYKNPQFFPHGGYVALRIGGFATDISDSTSGGSTLLKAFAGVLSGVWDVQANCNYVPE